MSQDSHGEDTVVEFRSAAPSARLKTFDVGDKRPSCKHRRIEVWRKEPIIECADCGAVVDPYYWIRERCNDWRDAVQAITGRVEDAKRELVELTEAIRLLRREYKDEAEKRRAESRLMILPPRKSVR